MQNKVKRITQALALVTVSIGLIVIATITLQPDATPPFYLNKIYHFLGGFLAAWFVVLYLADELAKLGKLKTFLVILAGTCFIGVAWEFAELASTLYAPPVIAYYFNIGDVFDTLGDLAIDTLGGFVFALIYYRRRSSF